MPHRLDRLGAGRRMDYATATPESGDGAARAAALLASLLD